MTPDVIVIGGGPAGSSAAIRLARRGRRVSLYEKSHFPRAKLCGGFLSPEGLGDLEDLDVLDSLRRSGVITLHRTVIASQRGTVIESELPEEALSISRDVMDDLLMQEARRSGVHVFEGEDGFHHIDAGASVIIAAGRSASKRETRQGNRYFGIQALFEGVDDVTDQVELDLVASGYVGLARQRHGVNVCALTTQKSIDRFGPSLDRVMKHFTQENPVLRAHMKDATRKGSWMAVGPVQLGVRQLVEKNTFYVGDAACVVDPFAGEGMSIGLYTSRLLVEAMDQTEKPATEAYAARWEEAFRPALRWNALMRMLYTVPVLRETALRALEWYPRGMNILTDLTRYRRITDEFVS